MDARAGAPAALPVRAQRPAHAGQPRHPAPLRPDPPPPDRDRRRGSPWRATVGWVIIGPHRRARRLAGPAGRHHPLGCLPRPAGRQVPGHRRSLGPGRPGDLPLAGGGPDRRPGADVSAYRTWAGRRGVSIPARWLGKLKTDLPAGGGGGRPVPLHRPSPPGWRSPCCGRRWASPWCRVSTLLPEPVAGRCGDATDVRCDVLAVGTELLLGQIVDTNSAWIGEQLAAAGIDSHLHVAVGDNQARVVETMRWLLAHSDALLVCGGLGPTPDDLTREAIAEVMGVGAGPPRAPRRRTSGRCSCRRGRPMPPTNVRQADVPKGGPAIPNPQRHRPGARLSRWTARSIYAVPGVPLRDAGHGDRRRDAPTCWSGRGSGAPSSPAASRRGARPSRPWPSASPAGSTPRRTRPSPSWPGGSRGSIVRITAKAPTRGPRRQASSRPRSRICGTVLGDLIFGVDDETMESVVHDLLRAGAGPWPWPSRSPAGWSAPGSSDAPGAERHLPGLDRLLRHRRQALAARGDRRERW